MRNLEDHNPVRKWTRDTNTEFTKQKCKWPFPLPTDAHPVPNGRDANEDNTGDTSFHLSALAKIPNLDQTQCWLKLWGSTRPPPPLVGCKAEHVPGWDPGNVSPHHKCIHPSAQPSHLWGSILQTQLHRYDITEVQSRWWRHCCRQSTGNTPMPGNRGRDEYTMVHLRSGQLQRGERGNSPCRNTWRSPGYFC